MSEATEQLCRKIIRARKAGRTTCRITERPASSQNKSVKAMADEFVESLGFAASGARWKEINAAQAQNIAVIVLHRDMAYRSKAMTSERAKNLGEQFLSAFENAQFLTNSVTEADAIKAWNSITEATFDAGIVCISPTHLGILWVEDED